MKRGKFAVLALALGAFAVVGLGGCTPQEKVYNFAFENLETQFEVGEEFALSENMKVLLEPVDGGQSLQLETPQTYDFYHDKQAKIYIGHYYTIDYSEYNANKGGDYPIYVTLKNFQNMPEIRSYFEVNVAHQINDWTTPPSLQSWTYGDTPVFTEPVAEFNNESMKYYWSIRGANSFVEITSDVVVELGRLGVGQYDLYVRCAQSDTYANLDFPLIPFEVEAQVLPAEVENALKTAKGVYTGLTVVPNFEEYAAFVTVDFNNETEYWVNAGKYQFKAETTVNYKWSDSDERLRTLEFEIVPAESIWNSEYVFEVNSDAGQGCFVEGQFEMSMLSEPVAGFGEVAFAYKLKSASEYTPISAYDIGGLSAGEYNLKAYIVSQSTNFVNPEPLVIEFTILPNS